MDPSENEKFPKNYVFSTIENSIRHYPSKRLASMLYEDICQALSQGYSLKTIHAHLKKDGKTDQQYVSFATSFRNLRKERETPALAGKVGNLLSDFGTTPEKIAEVVLQLDSYENLKRALSSFRTVFASVAEKVMTDDDRDVIVKTVVNAVVETIQEKKDG